MERHVIASFLYPFRRGGRLARWLVGSALVLVLPVSFPMVFGYAVGCVRSAACDPGAPPPRWRVGGRRLLADGLWTGLQAALLTAPFAVAAWLLAGTLGSVWRPTGGPFLNAALAWIVAVTVAALPWGVLMLVVLPPTLARFAQTGRPADLAALGWVVTCVRERYAQWNLVVVGVTTAWALAAAGLAVAGIGVVPGVFYAILVSAHACSALAPDRTPG
jgi:Protein of unknown function (DUF4013)